MKKRAIVLLLSAMLIVSSCGSSNSQQIDTNDSNNSVIEEEILDEVQEDISDASESESSEGVEVDEGLFDVELTVPADFIGESTQEELDAVCEENGFKSIILNEDGSATYTMTKKQHKELMDGYREDINNNLNEMIGSEEYPNITNIEANDNFTEFTVTTKNTELDMAESFSVLAFYMAGGMYNAFSGEEVENISVTFVNADTGDVIDIANSSDMEE